ncbi:hypothetical protein [Clostridium lundense]|uniref:hypothetical protein n=1 Tax=Clostridium lundense TaxID=319475 RepID=UPI00047F698C|nr:hypothetical protein [Clostridium lundense]
MKENLKIILSSVIISVLAFSLMGCSKNNINSSMLKGDNIVKAQDNIVKAQDKGQLNVKEYSKELSAYFSTNEMREFHYNGTLEYGEVIKLDKITGTKESLILQFNGEIKNESDGEGPAKDKFHFQKEYTIDADSVKEIQKNGDMKKKYAAIEKGTILKMPIIKGNTWENEVEFKGNKYIAKNTIVDVTKDKDNKNLVKTETVIKGVQGYPKNTYKEIKVYCEGKGLVEFNNTILIKGSGEKTSVMDFSYRQF